MDTIQVHYNRSDFSDLPSNKIYDAYERKDDFILFNNTGWFSVDKKDVSVIRNN